MIRRILSSKYLHNIATLTIGSMIGYAVIVAASPMLTRLYGPEQLGAFALMMAVVNALSPVINGHYDFPIVSAETEEEAAAVTIASIVFGLAATAISGFLMMLFYRVRPGLFGEAGAVLFYAVPLILISTFVNPLTSYNNRNKQYRLLSTVTAARSATQATGQVLLGFGHCGVIGLILGQLTASVVGINLQARFIWSRMAQFRAVSLSQVTTVYRKYYQQPIYSAPALLLSTLAYSAINFIIYALYGLREVGYYSLSFSLLGLPLTLVTRNVASVFLRNASREKTTYGNFAHTYTSTLAFLVLLAIPTFGTLMYVAQPVFGFVFGAGWERAGRFVQVLSPMFLTRFVATSLVHAMFIGNKQRAKLMLQLSFMVETVIAYGAASMYAWPADIFLTTVSALFSLTYATMIWISWRASHEQAEPIHVAYGKEVTT